VIQSQYRQERSDRRSGRRTHLRGSVAIAIGALVIAACGSADDTVTSDASSEDAALDATESGSDDTADVETTIAGEAVDAEFAGLQQTGPIDIQGDVLVTYGEQADDPAVGFPAPVVSGESFDGTEIVLGAPTENPTLVVFLAHWCPHCNAEVPELIGLDADGRLPEGLDVVGVSTAVAPDRDNFPPSDWIDDRGWPWPTMADDEIGSAIVAYGGSAFPFAVVLDTDGTVLARRAGQATGEETVAFLEAALTNAGA